MDRDPRRGLSFNLFRLCEWVTTEINDTVDKLTIEDFRRVLINKSRRQYNLDIEERGEGDEAKLKLIKKQYRKRKDHIIFFLNITLSLLITIKLVVYSFMTSTDEPYKYLFASDYRGNGLLSTIYQSICFDFYSIFPGKNLLNKVMATCLLPTTLYRVTKFIKTFHWKVNTVDCVQGGDVEIEDNGEDDESSAINIVQINLSYLGSLKASTSDWVKSVTSYWFHKHPVRNFWREQELTLSLCPATSNFATSPGDTSLMSKLYFNNLICFDDCYEPHFPIKDPAFIYTHCNDLVPATSLRASCRVSHEELGVIGPTPGAGNSNGTSSGSTNQRYGYLLTATLPCGYSPEQINIFGPDCDKTLLARIGHKKFVAKPIHRMDQNEMAMLSFLVILLYVLPILNYNHMFLLYMCSHFGIRDLHKFNLVVLFECIGEYMSSLRLALDFGQFVIMQVIVVLSVYDVHNFTTCCLICNSRARYVRVQLEELCKLFELANSERCSTDPSAVAKAMDLMSKTQLVDEINKRLEILLELVHSLQCELSDLKRFFSTYLSLEMMIKTMSTIFSVMIFLEEAHLFDYMIYYYESLAAWFPIIFVTLSASLIENEFRQIGKRLGWILYNGRQLIRGRNKLQVIMRQSDYLAQKSNRSFVVVGNFSLTLGSLLPVVAWVATGVVLLRH